MFVTVTGQLFQTIAFVSVPILDDSTVESDETFYAVLTSDHPNVVFGEDTATITIIDNDGEALC